ncbi:addiction module protein [bacterium]|nr:addiction module protein [bacterium]
MVQAPTNVDSLFDQALSLASEERAELAHRLIDSIVDSEDVAGIAEVDAYWEAELRRQDEEIAAGTARLVPFEQGLAEMLRPLT